MSDRDARVLCLECGCVVPSTIAPCWTVHPCAPESPVYVWDVWRALPPGTLHYEGTVTTHEATITAAQAAARRRWGKATFAVEVNVEATAETSDPTQGQARSMPILATTAALLVIAVISWLTMHEDTPRQQADDTPAQKGNPQ